MICQPVSFLLINPTSAPPGPLLDPPRHEEAKLHISQTPPSGTPAQPPAARRSSSRITNRTVQALWQTNLSLCNREGSRSEVLSVRESPRLFQTGNGLRSTRVQGAGGFTLGQLQIGARYLGRDLRHQSRAAIPTRGAVVTQCHRLFARQRSPCLVFL